MSRHWAEQQVLDDYQEKYDLCVNIAYLIDQSKHAEEFKEVQTIVLKKAAGCKMMIDHMNKNVIIGE